MKRAIAQAITQDGHALTHAGPISSVISVMSAPLPVLHMFRVVADFLQSK